MASKPKSVLITGCSAGGIGAALATVFQEKGYRVFATAREPSNVPQTLSSAANVRILTLDVLSPGSVAAAVEDVGRETGGRLDILVNNSGGGLFAPALDTSIEKGKKVFELNFWAPMAMLQAFAPLLIEARGCLVNNSSANAYMPMAFMSKFFVPTLLRSPADSPGIYNSSKAALAIASETWRRELEPLGVRTITLITCAVKTNFFLNNHGVDLPETSNYLQVQNLINGLTDGRLQANAIDSREYAIKVVQEIEKGTTGTIWAGTNSFVSRLVCWLSPKSVMDKILESIVPVAGEMAKAARGEA